MGRNKSGRLYLSSRRKKRIINNGLLEWRRNRKSKKEAQNAELTTNEKEDTTTVKIEAGTSGNPTLRNLSHDELFMSGKVCDVHFHESDILPSGRLQYNSIPIPYIPIKEEHESPPTSPPSPDPHPSWRSHPTLRTYSSANAENAEEKQKQQMLRNIELSYPPVDSQYLTEDSNPSQTSESEPIASTSKAVKPATVTSATVRSATVTSEVSQPKSLIQKSTVAESSVTKKTTDDETTKLRETIKRLEEKNIQLQVENESYRIKNYMLETKQKQLIVQLKTIIQKKDPLDLGDSRLVYEQHSHSERLTVSSASTSGSRKTTTDTVLLAGQGHDSDIGATHSQEFSDPDDPTDNSAFHDALQPPDIEIDVGPIFETVDIKPNIELDNLPPPPPSPPPKRKRTAAPDVEVEEEEEQDPLAIKRTRSSPLVGYGEDNDKEDDDNFSGDEFDEEEDGDKVRRAYQLLKSVFDKKDKYDIFGHRLAARLRALKSAKVCRHVQDILESVIDDAEAGKYNNV